MTISLNQIEGERTGTLSHVTATCPVLSLSLFCSSWWGRVRKARLHFLEKDVQTTEIDVIIEILCCSSPNRIKAITTNRCTSVVVLLWSRTVSCKLQVLLVGCIPVRSHCCTYTSEECLRPTPVQYYMRITHTLAWLWLPMAVAIICFNRQENWECLYSCVAYRCVVYSCVAYRWSVWWMIWCWMQHSFQPSSWTWVSVCSLY